MVPGGTVGKELPERMPSTALALRIPDAQEPRAPHAPEGSLMQTHLAFSPFARNAFVGETESSPPSCCLAVVAQETPAVFANTLLCHCGDQWMSVELDPASVDHLPLRASPALTPCGCSAFVSGGPRENVPSHGRAAAQDPESCRTTPLPTCVSSRDGPKPLITSTRNLSVSTGTRFHHFRILRN